MAHLLGQGPGWRLSEYVCAAGPGDPSFEERHDWVAVGAVIEGAFTYHTDSGKALMHPGAILLGNPGACFECGHDHSAGDRCIGFQLAPEYFAEVAASVAGSARYRFPTAMLPAQRRLLPWMARVEAQAMGGRQCEADEAIPRLMEALIGALSGASAERPRLSPRDHRRISEALRLIETNAADGLDLDRLAGAAAMSKYHFLRTFRHVVGMTPYQFLLGTRMRRAAVRLITSAEPVSAIAFDAGFGDLSTFNARFKQQFGSSPTVFRRRERG